MDNLLPEYYIFIGHNKREAEDFCKWASQRYGFSLKVDVISQDKLKRDGGRSRYSIAPNYKVYIAYLPNSFLANNRYLLEQMYFENRKIIKDKKAKELNAQRSIKVTVPRRRINKLSLNNTSKMSKAVKAVKAAKPARRKIKIEKDT